MKTKLVIKVFTLFIMAVILLSACTSAAPTLAPTAAPAAKPTQTPAPEELILATTTSTQDSGLLGFILPDFEKQFNVKLKVVAVGSGQAIQLGKDGNADVLLVHSPAAEKQFMDNKDGVRREDVMYNDYVLVGPASDPAKIAGMKSSSEAFKAIAAAKATFISRGDDSGTHVKEKSIWAAANIEPKGDWYLSTGQSMGTVLVMSAEKNAYTLADRATYLTQTQKGLQLKVLVEGEPLMYNPYGVIAVDPAKSPKINNALANKLIDWLISVPVQEKISTFGKAEFGKSLFFPSSRLWKEAHPS